MEGLHIAQILTEFLDSAMDIAHIDIDFLDGLTIDGGAETQHTVSGGMLRADVHHEVILFEDPRALMLDRAVGLLHPRVGVVGLAFVLNRDGVDFRIGVVILAEGVTHPVNVEEKATHIGIVYKDNPVEVIDFALIYAGDAVKVGNGMNHRIVAVGGLHLYRDKLL